jgi:rsbT co-antagonist protein RsbR
VPDEAGLLTTLVSDHQNEILPEWLELQKKAGALSTGRIQEAELATQCRNFLRLLRDGLAAGGIDFTHAAYGPIRDLVSDIFRTRALQGYSPAETSTFLFSLKEPLFNTLNRDKRLSQAQVAQAIWSITRLLDEVGLYTMEVFIKSREELVLRQKREITELSTPVVKLWAGVLALPIIGTLDSERTQIVMENLLTAIVDSGAEIAIIDITGVPTVDTLTAQHLLKTVAAARLMGADCIISGIRPQIAQTIVHLGVELNVVTKATLADAFAVALRRTGKTVTRIAAGAREKEKTRNGADEKGA